MYKIRYPGVIGYNGLKALLAHSPGQSEATLWGTEYNGGAHAL